MTPKYLRPRASWLLILAAATVFGSELLFRLGTVTHGKISVAEYATFKHANSLQSLSHNPIFAPYFITQRLILSIVPSGSAAGLRLGSVVWGIVAAALLYIVVRRWFGRLSATLTTILLAGSLWFLIVARLASPAILYLVAPLSLLAIVAWQRAATETTPLRSMPFWLVGLIFGLMLYTPGYIWLVCILSILQPKLLIQIWQSARITSRVIGIVILIGLLTPLLYALIRQPALVSTWLGYSIHLERLGPLAVLKRIAGIPLALLVRAPNTAGFAAGLGHLAALPAASAVLVVSGAYACYRYSRRKGLLLLAILLVGWLLAVIGEGAAVLLLVGPLYVVLAAGFTYLMRLWFRVFPRNPIARRIGLAAASLLVVSLTLFGWHAYFVAWPHNRPIQALYQQKL